MFEILAIFTFVSIVGIVIKIIGQQKCPDDLSLKKAVLHHKSIDDKSSERIIAHLGICEKCRDKVTEMNS